MTSSSSDQTIRDLTRQLQLSPNDPSLQEALISAKLRTVNVTRLLIEDAIRFRRLVSGLVDGRYIQMESWLRSSLVDQVTVTEICDYLDGKSIKFRVDSLRSSPPDPMDDVSLAESCPSCGGSITLGERNAGGLCSSCYWQATQEEAQQAREAVRRQERARATKHVPVLDGDDTRVLCLHCGVTRFDYNVHYRLMHEAPCGGQVRDGKCEKCGMAPDMQSTYLE